MASSPKKNSVAQPTAAEQKESNGSAKVPATAGSAPGQKAEEHAAQGYVPHKGSHYHQKNGAADATAAGEEGKHTVFVSKLDWTVDEKQLWELFSECKGLKDVRLIRDFMQRSKGYAYLDFETEQQVDLAASKMNNKVVNKRKIFVHKSVPTKPLFEEKVVFVAALGASVTEGAVLEEFKAFGEITSVRIPTDPATKKPRGHAYVEFKDASSVEPALALNDSTKLGSAALKVTRSIPMKDHRHRLQRHGRICLNELISSRSSRTANKGSIQPRKQQSIQRPST